MYLLGHPRDLFKADPDLVMADPHLIVQNHPWELLYEQ